MRPASAPARPRPSPPGTPPPLCPAGTSSASDLPTMTRTAVWSAGKARPRPTGPAPAPDGRAPSVPRPAPSAGRTPPPRAAGAPVPVRPRRTTGTAPAATSSGPTAPSGSSVPSRSAPGEGEHQGAQQCDAADALRQQVQGEGRRGAGQRQPAHRHEPQVDRARAQPRRQQVVGRARRELGVASSRRRGQPPDHRALPGAGRRDPGQAGGTGRRQQPRPPGGRQMAEPLGQHRPVPYRDHGHSSSGSTQHTRRTSRAPPARRTRTDAGRATRVRRRTPPGRTPGEHLPLSHHKRFPDPRQLRMADARRRLTGRGRPDRSRALDLKESRGSTVALMSMETTAWTQLHKRHERRAGPPSPRPRDAAPHRRLRPPAPHPHRTVRSCSGW